MQLIWTPGMTLAQSERLVIEAAMKFTQDNKSAVARILDISVRTIDNKLALYEREDKAKKEELDEHAKRRAEEVAKLKGNFEISSKDRGAVFKDDSSNPSPAGSGAGSEGAPTNG